MKILVVSDTHGKIQALERVLKKEGHPDLLIHCGDLEGQGDLIKELADCPCYLVGGNCDLFTGLPQEQVLEVEGKRIFVTHGHIYGVDGGLYALMEAGRSRNCQVILFGHTHCPMVDWHNGFLLMNPGSLTFPRQEGRIPTYGVITTDGKGKMDAGIRCLKRGFFREKAGRSGGGRKK